MLGEWFVELSKSNEFRKVAKEKKGKIVMPIATRTAMQTAWQKAVIAKAAKEGVHIIYT
jgi:hypothetical protein